MSVSQQCRSCSSNPRNHGAQGTIDTRAASLYDETMLATERDRQIVLTIARFKQLTSGQLSELLFHDVASHTPLARALRRLVASGHLARIERRLVGGTGAGSGQYVYQLGSAGWRLSGREGRYWAFRSVDYHTLAIADVFVSLKKAERERTIKVLTYETEPDTWQELSGVKLTPDMYVELAIPSRRETVVLWIEVDLGTERQKQIKDKFARYWHAYQYVEGAEVFPLVVVATPDKQRTYDVQRWLNSGPEEARKLFRVVEASELIESLM